MQGRYQGIDWRDQSNWGCNAAENPFNYVVEDAVTLAPMELMFVKVKETMIALNAPSVHAAIAYDDWYNHTADVRPPDHMTMWTATALRTDACHACRGLISAVRFLQCVHVCALADECLNSVSTALLHKRRRKGSHFLRAQQFRAGNAPHMACASNVVQRAIFSCAAGLLVSWSATHHTFAGCAAGVTGLNRRASLGHASSNDSEKSSISAQVL